jgi:hypothetical protein
MAEGRRESDSTFHTFFIISRRQGNRQLLRTPFLPEAAVRLVRVE